MEPQSPWRLYALLIVTLLAGAWIATRSMGPRPAAACRGPAMPAGLPEATVVRVVDGDTLRVQWNGRREPVRLIGVDTPEVHESDKLRRDAQRTGRPAETIQKLGEQAWEFTRRRLDGRRVRLEFDVEHRDRYGRLLAYVWLSDGTLYNAVLLGEGYAQILTVPPNVKYQDLLLRCQREARQASRGLWAK